MLESQKGLVVVKLFGWRSRLHYILSPTFPSRAWASWETARGLLQVGARTPKPLYVYTRRTGGFIQENLFITAAIHPRQSLRALLKSDATQESMEAAVGDLARSIGRMHAGAIMHNDLTTANFLVCLAGEVYIVDLNRARRRSRLTPHQRLKDLARISFSTREPSLEEALTRRFFRVYSQETETQVDWLTGYYSFRRRRVARQRWRRRLRRLVGGK